MLFRKQQEVLQCGEDQEDSAYLLRNTRSSLILSKKELDWRSALFLARGFRDRQPLSPPKGEDPGQSGSRYSAESKKGYADSTA